MSKVNKNLASLIDIHTEISIPTTRDYYQIGSIDPAVKNFALRVERRYNLNNGTVFVTPGLHTVWDISPKGKYKSQWSNLNDKLDQEFNLFDNCDYIIIEKQLKINKYATAVQQHVISYLSIRLKNNHRKTKIFIIDSKLKNIVLQSKKGDNIKLLSIQRCLDILMSRNEQSSIDIINATNKKDDLADVICQIEAFCIYTKLNNIDFLSAMIDFSS